MPIHQIENYFGVQMSKLCGIYTLKHVITQHAKKIDLSQYLRRHQLHQRMKWAKNYIVMTKMKHMTLMDGTCIAMIYGTNHEIFTRKDKALSLLWFGWHSFLITWLLWISKNINKIYIKRFFTNISDIFVRVLNGFFFIVMPNSMYDIWKSMEIIFHRKKF